MPIFFDDGGKGGMTAEWWVGMSLQQIVHENLYHGWGAIAKCGPIFLGKCDFIVAQIFSGHKPNRTPDNPRGV